MYKRAIKPCPQIKAQFQSGYLSTATNKSPCTDFLADELVSDGRTAFCLRRILDQRIEQLAVGEPFGVGLRDKRFQYGHV